MFHKMHIPRKEMAKSNGVIKECFVKELFAKCGKDEGTQTKDGTRVGPVAVPSSPGPSGGNQERGAVAETDLKAAVALSGEQNTRTPG